MYNLANCCTLAAQVQRAAVVINCLVDWVLSEQEELLSKNVCVYSYMKPTCTQLF